MSHDKSPTNPLKADEPAVKQQQQILFDEPEILIDASVKEVNKQQIIFENQDLLPSQFNDENDGELMQDIKLPKRPRWMWRIALSLLAILLCVEGVNFFMTGFVDSPILTSMYAVIVGCLAFLAGGALWRELSGVRQLKLQEKMKQQAEKTFEDEAPLDVAEFCQKISANLPCDIMSSQEEQWQTALQGQYSDSELLQLYSKLVLSKVDQKVLAEISKFSTEAVVLVSLSPVAIVDMLIMLWRNLRMLDKISALYGLKLGYWSRIKLIKQVFINMAYAGASELIADFGTEMIGADLLGKMSARLAQGLGAGMLTSRLGLRAMQLCRPLPFDDSSPKLGDVRKEILSQLKALIKK